MRPLDDWISWEDKKFAIVTPLYRLYPQLVNLNCYDTFILGNLQLDQQTILVAPEGTKAEGLCFPIFEYGADSSLREAVDQLISSHGGWSVTMSDKDLEDIYPPAIVGQDNINTPEVFQPILDALPHLSLGLRFYPYHGEAWRFAKIEVLLNSLYQISAEDVYPNKAYQDNFLDLYTQLMDNCKILAKTYLKAPSLDNSCKTVLSEQLMIVEQVLEGIAKLA